MILKVSSRCCESPRGDPPGTYFGHPQQKCQASWTCRLMSSINFGLVLDITFLDIALPSFPLNLLEFYVVCCVILCCKNLV